MARGALIAVAALAASACTKDAGQQELVVFAASSLREPFTELGKRFEAAHPGVKVVFNFAGTQELKAQLDHGAEADVFAAADRVYLPGAEIFAKNELVIALAKTASVGSIFDLMHTERIVIGAPEVPIGRYTEQVFQRVEAAKPGFFSAVIAQVVSREPNAKQVLAKVSLGDANAAIVYRSDVRSASNVRVVEIPASFNVSAEYPIKALKPAGEELLVLVRSAEGRSVLESSGFSAPP